MNVFNSQTQEAAWYKGANEELVAMVRQGLVQEVAAAVEERKAVLEPKAVLRIKEYLDSDSLVNAFLMLRGQASRIRGQASRIQETSSAYWDLIDACSFFFDATNDAWPYMTQERRHQSLLWSLKYLQEHSFIS